MNIFSKPSSASFLLLGAALVGGCYSAQLDPDVAGVFVCGDGDDDEPDATCPASQLCVNERCEDADDVPVLSVIDPEDEKSISRVDVLDGFLMGPGPAPLLDLSIRIQGSLELVSASSGRDPTFGEGHVIVFIDGQEQETVDTGSIGASTPVMVRVPAIAGPHRIMLQAYRNDGVAYDNPEATATRLFWLGSDVIRRPFVAVKSPWPGTVFGPEDQLIEVVMASSPEVELDDPGAGTQEGKGHVHVYYDARPMLPECVQDPGCDSGYLGVAGASKIAEITLPMSGAQSTTLTGVLRNMDHSAYGVPFDCDPAQPGPLDVCSPVFETIEILRVAD